MSAKSWVCTVCGYVHEGDTPPEKCPQCSAPKEKFKLQGGGAERIAKQHAAGKRTARENVAAVVDAGSFVEYGALVIAVFQRYRAPDTLHDLAAQRQS